MVTAGTHELFLTRKRRKSEGFGRKRRPENRRPHQPLARCEQPEFCEGASEQKRRFSGIPIPHTPETNPGIGPGTIPEEY